MIINKKDLKIPIIILSSALIILAILIIAGIFKNVTMDKLTRDMSALANIHPFSGILSNLGILIFCATGSIMIFAAFLMRKSDKKDFNFLLFSSLFTFYLLFDDLFLFHESLAKDYFGINEKFVLFMIGFFTLAYFYFFRKEILRGNMLLLISALFSFGISIFIDVFLEEFLSILIGHWEYLIEDGFKWLGITFWSGYYIERSYQLLKNH